MKARMFVAALVSAGLVFALFVAIGQATEPETAHHAIPLFSLDIHTNAAPETISNSAPATLTSVFTMFFPAVGKTHPWPVYLWLLQQQHATTGLVADQQDGPGTTYDNALAVVAFTLKGDSAKAERVLDYFDSRAGEFFAGRCSRFDLPCAASDPCDSTHPCGFFQSRNPHTGDPYTDSNRWIGDMAWLLVAIHHYQAKTADASYTPMANAIVRLFRNFQQPAGCVANGWIHADREFTTTIYAEGNLNVYKALSLANETQTASQVKQCLDYHNFGHAAWERGPLDLHFWRVLSLGNEYGYALLDTERTDNPAIRYKSTIAYNNSSVTGFLPFPAYCHTENIWAEGTGGMALAFYKAGYRERGDFYVGQLGKLLFEPRDYPGTQALAYYALPSPCDNWPDPTKGHVSATAWYIFAKARYDPFDDVVMNSFQLGNPAVQIEAENYVVSSPVGVRLDHAGQVFEGDAIHIGGDNNIPGDESGWALYEFNVLTPTTVATITMRYADHVGGDAVVILLDGNAIVNSYTDSTGGWFNYRVVSFPVGRIQLQPGLHTLRPQVTDNGTWGTTVDYWQMLIP